MIDGMKVVYVVSGNRTQMAPFISEQIASIPNIQSRFFLIRGSGFLGYLRQIIPLSKFIRKERPDIIHSHYGLCGLVAGLIPTRIPKIVTYHGSDVNNPKNRWFSAAAHFLCDKSLFVSNQLRITLGVQSRYEIIPCGIDREVFRAYSKNDARDVLGLDRNEILILFSSAFGNHVKNYPIAKEAIEHFEDKTGVKVFFQELKGFSRRKVALWMNAADVCLMTSLSEGSPQFIKEALACERPIVSTNVGDVKERLAAVDGAFLVDFDAENISSALEKAVRADRSVVPSGISDELDNNKVGFRIRKIYETLKTR